MADDRAIVRNAADPKQVRRASQRDRDRGERFRLAMRSVMSTPDGRFVMWELLERSGLYKTIWDPSSRIHFNEGRRNFGLELMALAQDDDQLFLLMESEGRARKRLEDRETDAAHTPRAEQENGS